MNLSRRTLLATVAPGAAVAVAGCANIAGTGFGIAVGPTGSITVTLPPAVTDAVQSAINTAEKVIPTVESIAAEAAALFGPQYSAIVTIGSAALNTLITTIESIIANQAPAASSKLRKLGATSSAAAVVVGKQSPTQFAPNGVVIKAYVK